MFFSVECRAQEISGYIKEMDHLGNPNLSITAQEVKDAGFDYGDLLEVEFEHIGTVIMPFTTSFTEVGVGGLSLCDYRAKGDNFHFSICQANFSARVGGVAGEKFTIRMKQMGGFLEQHNLMQAVYTIKREHYSSDEVFANFREVRTKGIGKGILYRSSNPLNSGKNKNRYIYADRLAEKAGIATEINLSDTDEKVEKMIASEGYAATYCPALYKKGSVINLGIQWDMFCQDTYEKIAKAVRFMIAKENKPPFLIHCVEGKDRCGFFAMLLEGLAGASYQEIKDDYML
ncbi:MAG TPA: hypothetical protein DDY68_00740, partial [Porphyromonadaceae bacterium]|nr:hypothetical protein [Porphyromonadaceae bacterium]